MRVSRPYNLITVLAAASPALVASSGIVNAAVLSGLVLVVLLPSSAIAAWTRRILSGRLHLIGRILSVAVLVTAADLVLGALAPGVRASLGIWFLLTGASCAVLVPPAPPEVRPALIEALARTGALALGLMVLGGARELLDDVIPSLRAEGVVTGAQTASPYLLAPALGLAVLGLALALARRARGGEDD
jgi:Na+-translocating ferredoxin:NAD+ oxidoreductase RnfE subunit